MRGTKMKNITIIALIVVLLALVAPTAQAQVPTYANTTLSSAITGTQAGNIVVASSTGIAAGYVIVIDHEGLLISNSYVAGSTTIQIATRGYNGTVATPHMSGQIALIGPVGYFSSRDFYGACTASVQTVLPVISFNVSARDLRMYNCNNGTWASQVLPNDTGASSAASATSTTSGGTRQCNMNIFSAIPNNGATTPLAYSSFGTNTAHVAGTTFYASIVIPGTVKITGVSILNGLTVGTDKNIVTLYRADGTWLASSSITGSAGGVTTSGANAFQDLAFTSPYLASGPARYWIGVQTQGTTDTLRTLPSLSFFGILSSSVAGTFGVVPSTITTLSTSIANTAPFACIY